MGHGYGPWVFFIILISKSYFVYLSNMCGFWFNLRFGLLLKVEVFCSEKLKSYGLYRYLTILKQVRVDQ